MDTETFVERLDDRLDTAAYADLDASANGLQVAGPDKIDHAAFAVDAAIETAERAADADADALVVHHGLFWGEFERATGSIHDRLTPFFEHDMALYVAHLPLDGHQELGNAAGIVGALSSTIASRSARSATSISVSRDALPRSRPRNSTTGS